MWSFTERWAPAREKRKVRTRIDVPGTRGRPVGISCCWTIESEWQTPDARTWAGEQ